MTEHDLDTASPSNLDQITPTLGDPILDREKGPGAGHGGGRMRMWMRFIGRPVM